MALLRENYSDFGLTIAAEKLRERHQISVSVETLRHWMIADGLWVPHSRRKPRAYQPRYRRHCQGELVQIDGSHHDWLLAVVNQGAIVDNKRLGAVLRLAQLRQDEREL